MQQIMRATRKTAVSDTMDSVKKMVEDIPYLKLDKDQEETPKMNEEILNEQIDNSLKTDFEEFLAEDPTVSSVWMCLLPPWWKNR